jgi:hypothetical protein
MDQGYIKLWRKTIQSQVFSNEGLFKVWAWCLMKASYRKRCVGFQTGKGGVEVNIEPGQFVFGRRSAAKELGMDPNTIWKRMHKLKNLQNLTLESNQQYTIVSIINWNTYQEENLESNLESNQQVTSKYPASNTNNKDKKEKNVKKENNNKILYPEFVYLAEGEHKKLIEQFGDAGTKERIERLNIYLGSTGKTYKSHYYTILNWERRNGNGGSIGHSKEGRVESGEFKQPGKYSGIGTVFEGE